MVEHHDLFDSVLIQVSALLSHFRRVLFCGLLCSASEQLEGRTTFLLVGDGDSHEFTKKYRDAKAAGVPIVHVSCLNFLLLVRSFLQAYCCYSRTGMRIVVS